MLMKSWVKFCCPQNISEALLQINVPAFSLAAEDGMQMWYCFQIKNKKEKGKNPLNGSIQLIWPN